jgi:hypothetical protein
MNMKYRLTTHDVGMGLQMPKVVDMVWGSNGHDPLGSNVIKRIDSRIEGGLRSKIESNLGENDQCELLYRKHMPSWRGDHARGWLNANKVDIPHAYNCQRPKFNGTGEVFFFLKKKVRQGLKRGKISSRRDKRIRGCRV